MKSANCGVGKYIHFAKKINHPNVIEDANKTDDQPNVYLKRVK